MFSTILGYKVPEHVLLENMYVFKGTISLRMTFCSFRVRSTMFFRNIWQVGSSLTERIY